MNEEDLEALRRLYARKDQLHSDAEGRAWLEDVSGLLHRLAPERAREFDELAPNTLVPLSQQTMAPIWHRVGAVVHAGIIQAEKAAEERPRTADQDKREELEGSRAPRKPIASFWDQYGKPIIVGVVVTVVAGLLLAWLL